jgi:hypothetical protein
MTRRKADQTNKDNIGNMFGLQNQRVNYMYFHTE